MTSTTHLERAAEPLAATDPRQLVVFRIGTAEYAVTISCVQEIIRYLPPRPMPGGAPDVEGIIDLRGRIIPVFDLRRILGAHGERPDEAKIVVANVGDATLGIEVDAVTEVLTVDAATCEAPPAVADQGATHGFIETIVKLEGRLLVELDLERLLGVGARF